MLALRFWRRGCVIRTLASPSCERRRPYAQSKGKRFGPVRLRRDAPVEPGAQAFAYGQSLRQTNVMPEMTKAAHH
jgi:hypothetical protein